ncbi:hypothetical protein ACFL6U_00685 [Planctomycetota bacterium]
MQRIVFVTFLIMLCIIGCGVQTKSDEEVLRKEFSIPESAELLMLKAFPELEQSDHFGREGLKIDAVFKFTSEGFQTYRSQAEKGGTWQQLPVPKDFLMKMGRIKFVSKQRKEYTEEQIYEHFLTQLPLDVKSGLYQCRSAGDNIMHNRKKIHTSLDHELNDFMFAILDFDKQSLKIKVRTCY